MEERKMREKMREKGGAVPLGKSQRGRGLGKDLDSNAHPESALTPPGSKTHTRGSAERNNCGAP